MTYYLWISDICNKYKINLVLITHLEKGIIIVVGTYLYLVVILLIEMEMYVNDSNFVLNCIKNFILKTMILLTNG